MPSIMTDDNERMRSVGFDELGHLPFVRHQVDPALMAAAWRSGRAAAVEGRRRHVDGMSRFVIGFGPTDDLASLLTRLAEQVEPPDRVMVDADAATLRDTWPVAEVRQWHWMLSTTLPSPAEVAVVEATDMDEVATLLDAEAPGSHARPGAPGIEAWLGVRENGRLVAVGAVVRQPDGSGHLRAVTVATDARRRGLGRQLSRALTRRAMTGPGIASLGVYVDNEPALRIYRELGYSVVHTFTSGQVTARDNTTAATPSR